MKRMPNSTSDLLILILGATLTTIVGVASYFAVKWIERVDKLLEVMSADISKVSEQVLKIMITGGIRPEELKRELEIQVAKLRKNPPNDEKLDRIEREVREVYETVHGRVIPILDSQKETFGRVLVIEGNQQAYEKKLVTMYEVITQLLKARKSDPK
jgi:SepF-like predicted cell division protein (DUF552 family)